MNLSMESRSTATGSVWKLDGTSATFDDGRLVGRVDLLAPLRGLHAIRFAGRPFGSDEGLLGVDIGTVAADDLSLPETYARVDDLVATYHQTERRPFRLQAYWRRVNLEHGANATAIELQVSINTSLLDTHPSVPVTSRVVQGFEATTSPDRRYWVAAAPGAPAYFEAVHPADERGDRAARAAGQGFGSTGSRSSTAKHVLFGDFLEKGVIVRARVRGAVLPAGATTADFDAMYDAFVNEPPPLTT